MPEQVQAQQEGIISRFFSTIVFWWLTTMAMVTLALAATIPSWVEYRQVVALRTQMQQEVEHLQKQVDRNNYFIDSYRTSPQALDLLAISEFGYRRPDEAPLPLPQQIAASFRPAGYTAMSEARGAAGPTSQPAPKSADQMNRIERQVERCRPWPTITWAPARRSGWWRCSATRRRGPAW